VPAGPYTLERLGRDLLALLDALEIERAHICGLSLGGMTAQWLAVSHPERVVRAVFANTAARIGSEESWDARIASVRAGGLRSIRDASLARYFSEPFRQRHPDVAQRTGDLLEATPEDGYIAACEALRIADLRGVVAGIRAPTLVVSGALDETTPAAQGQELHAAIAGSELAILDAGHLSNIEQADAFNERVLGFLTQP
jgi:3-oxoadipate enol-lactonase